MIKKQIVNSFLDLIIVPGHALFNDDVTSLPADISCEDNWVLLPYQIGEVKFYLEHIKYGLKEVGQNKTALLYFSGGHTRQNASKWSEAETYWTIAKSGCPKCFFNQLKTDNNSYDSFQNLFCSIRDFTETTGHLPRRITIVGWKFKEERYRWHCQTIGFPLDRFIYIGVNNPQSDDYKEAEKRTVQKFKINPLGLSGINIDKPEGRIWNDGMNRIGNFQESVFDCNLSISI